ncbi:MAG: DUF72 domain-containing protein [Caldilineaceae bacterium]|nr:DUF72 domain-containing protein [Caldilineaceae bacterium]
MASINLGTSSWLFDEWRGVFFPEGVTKARYLPYYATQFNSVEVNTSFYGVPRAKTLINWVESVPAGFTFCLKFPRAISHEKRLVDCEEETRIFLDVLRSLGEAAAPALLQFPPDFTRQQHGKQLATFLDWLAPQLDPLRIGVEVRALDLMTPAFATFLAERQMAYVLVDRVATPDAYPFWHELLTQGNGPDFTLIRWIGDDKHGPTGNDALVAPNDEALDRWAERLAALQRAGTSIYGYMHNPYEGHSPASLRRLQERLAPFVDLPPWPPEGTTTFPDDSTDDQQLSLF